MADRKPKIDSQSEPDSVWLLKVVLFFIIGTMWIRFDTVDEQTWGIPFGFIIGLYFAHHDHFQIDRKIEYALLFAASVMSFYLPVGFVLLIT